jgi:hypothetical protein
MLILIIRVLINIWQTNLIFQFLLNLDLIINFKLILKFVQFILSLIILNGHSAQL